MLNLLSPIRDIMSKDLITVQKSDTLTKVEEIFNANKIHHILVTEGSNLSGIISKSDYLFFKHGYTLDNSNNDVERLETHYVDQIMTTGVAKMESDEKINVALEIFKENLFHAIPVEEDDKVVGIVTTYDVIHALAEGNGAVSEYGIE